MLKTGGVLYDNCMSTGVKAFEWSMHVGNEECSCGFIKIKTRLTAFVRVDCDTRILAIHARSESTALFYLCRWITRNFQNLFNAGHSLYIDFLHTSLLLNPRKGPKI